MADVRPGQIWQKSNHERITVQEVEGTTVSGALSDTNAGTTAVWVGAVSDFDAFTLVEDSAER